MSDFDLNCELFGFYVAYWPAPNKIQVSNFESLFKVLFFFSWPWMVDKPWIIYKQRKLIGRSATYLGV